jgi:hypothetical protein
MKMGRLSQIFTIKLKKIQRLRLLYQKLGVFGGMNFLGYSKKVMGIISKHKEY